MRVQWLGLAILCMFLSGCDADSSSGSGSNSNRATMCSSVSGNTLTVNCVIDSFSKCSDEGRNSLGTYKDWSECWDDTDSVLEHYRNTGNVRPGPASNEGSGFPSSPTNPGGGGTGGGSINCDNAWRGSPDDHGRFYCLAACGHSQSGHQPGVDANCNILSGFSAQARNACSYC